MGKLSQKEAGTMACPYYQEPAADQLLGCCNDDKGKIPSETHQKCLCLSFSGTYAGFCPVYTKFQQKESGLHSQGVLARIFTSLMAHLT